MSRTATEAAWELAPHHESDLGLVSGEEVAHRLFIPGPDAVEERSELVPSAWVPVVSRIVRRIARAHRGLLPRAGGQGRVDRSAVPTVAGEHS